MSGTSTYQPRARFMRWLERRLPIGGLLHSSFVAYPTPRNLNYWWTFGGILSFMLAVPLFPRGVLAVHYTPPVDPALHFLGDLLRGGDYGLLFGCLPLEGA